jgi:hypothetical protein
MNEDDNNLFGAPLKEYDFEKHRGDDGGDGDDDDDDDEGGADADANNNNNNNAPGSKSKSKKRVAIADPKQQLEPHPGSNTTNNNNHSGGVTPAALASAAASKRPKNTYAPQLKMGPDGTFIVDKDSLIVTAHEPPPDEPAAVVLYDDFTPAGTRIRKPESHNINRNSIITTRRSLLSLAVADTSCVLLTCSTNGNSTRTRNHKPWTDKELRKFYRHTAIVRLSLVYCLLAAVVVT